MYSLDKDSKVPLYKQLYGALKEDIFKNYKINDRFISIRKVVNLYNLSKTTVEKAYSQLVVEGYIDSFPKSGYIVLDTNDINFKKDDLKESLEEKQEYLYDFYPARLEKGSFPIKTWKSLSNKVFKEDLNLGAYPNGQGEYELRVEIAKYLKESRAVSCKAKDIVISNTFLDSMELLAKLLRKDNKYFAMEDPGYQIIKSVFEDFSYDVEKVPVDKNGVILEKVNTLKSKILYVTPSHQYPKGVSIPISNRLKLLNWAKETQSYIIEDDYDSELSYSNSPIPSLQGLDANSRVIYFGTFSKSLSAALRVSFMVLPKELFDRYDKTYERNIAKVNVLTQKVLAKFLQGGYYDRYLRKIRTQNKKKHDLMKKSLEKYLKDTFIFESYGAGLAIHINAKEKICLKTLNKLALEKKIKIYFAKEKAGENFEAIRLGFGGLKLEEIEDSIKLFSKVWFRVLKG